MKNLKTRSIFAGLPFGSRIVNVVVVLITTQLLVGVASKDVCDGKSNGFKFQDPSACRGFLFCYKEKTYQAYCDITEKFDSAKQACVRGNCPPCPQCDPECIIKPTVSCVGRPDGEFIRDPKDCAKFYMCIGEEPKPNVCPNGLLFDLTIDACNYAVFVDCNNNNPPGPTTPAPTPTASTNPPNVDPNSCQGKPNGYMFRDRNDCTKFYVCVYGDQTTHYCPSGLYFDTTLNVCNYPQNVDCSNNSPTSSTTTTTPKATTSTTKSTITTTPKTTTSTTKSTTPKTTTSTTTTQSPNVDPNSCVGKPNGYMFRDRDDCTKFYVCDNGQQTTHYCPSGLYFDTTLNVCNYPQNVDCSNNSPTSSTTTTTPKTTTSTTRSTTTTTPKTTTSTTKSTTTTTPKTTTSTTTTQSPNVDPNSCVGKPNGYMFRDRDDCTKFYVCDNGQQTTHYCPSGLYFDTTKNVCNFPYLVDCSNNSPTSSTTTTTPKTTTSTTRSTTTTTPKTTTSTTTTTPKTTTSTTPSTTTTTTPTTTTTTTTTTAQSITSTTIKDHEVDPNIKDCLGKPNGTFFRSTEHCRVYYVCRDGMAVKESCPRGQWFDNSGFVCNLRSLVLCPMGVD